MFQVLNSHMWLLATTLGQQAYKVFPSLHRVFFGQCCSGHFATHLSTPLVPSWSSKPRVTSSRYAGCTPSMGAEPSKDQGLPPTPAKLWEVQCMVWSRGEAAGHPIPRKDNYYLHPVRPMTVGDRTLWTLEAARSILGKTAPTHSLGYRKAATPEWSQTRMWLCSRPCPPRCKRRWAPARGLDLCCSTLQCLWPLRTGYSLCAEILIIPHNPAQVSGMNYCIFDYCPYHMKVGDVLDILNSVLYGV